MKKLSFFHTPYCIIFGGSPSMRSFSYNFLYLPRQLRYLESSRVTIMWMIYGTRITGMAR